MPTLLTRIDPARRCCRWYRVHVQLTLLEPFAVVCEWGSLRTAYRRMRSIPCTGRAEADELAERITCAQRQRKCGRVPQEYPA